MILTGKKLFMYRLYKIANFALATAIVSVITSIFCMMMILFS